VQAVAIIVKCECGQTFETRDENAGRRARCPECGRDLIVPKLGGFGAVDELTQFEPPTTTTSGKAIASLVLGLLSFVLCIFTGLPAIILGCLGINDVSRGKGRVKGQGMSIAGIILGALGCSLVPIALLLPAVQSAREAARRSQCVNNLKQIGLALHNYHSANNCFPPQAITDQDGKPLLSWRVVLLPYLEQAPLYNQFHLDEPWDSPNNRPLLDMIPMTYRCPSEVPEPGMTRYEVVVGPQYLFSDPSEQKRPTSMFEVTDGTSNTIAVGEAAQPVHWSAPDDIPFTTPLPNSGFASRHPGGFNTLFTDGSVRFVRNTIMPNILRALLTRNGGEVISSDSY
jgi:prepilin-type processing-associated H-X9-DG protein